MNIIYNNLGELYDLKTNQVIEFLKNNPKICDINKKVKQKNPELIQYTKIAFITDGNSKLGLGHVFRSLTLANEFRKKTRSTNILFNKKR